MLILCSCSANNDSIKVNYNGTNLNLKSEQFNAKEYQNINFSEKTNGKKPIIEINSEKLTITFVKLEYSKISCCDNSFFVGIDLGEFGGWVKQFPYYPNLNQQSYERTIVNENCLELIKIDNKRLFAITYTMNAGGNVYLLELNNGDWHLSLYASLDFSPEAVSYSDERLLLCGEGKIVIIDNTQSLIEIAESKVLSSMITNSIVFLNNKYYCVCDYGIYEYSPENNYEQWYPFNGCLY